jgi:hypothetical protein
MTMVKTYVLVTAAALLLVSTVTIAGEYQNLDAMGLASGKGQRTTCDIKEQIEGKNYCFGDESTRAQFMKDPAGNRAKADAFYAGKANDPNWTPCNYSSTGPNGCE